MVKAVKGFSFKAKIVEHSKLLGTLRMEKFRETNIDYLESMRDNCYARYEKAESKLDNLEADVKPEFRRQYKSRYLKSKRMWLARYKKWDDKIKFLRVKIKL